MGFLELVITVCAIADPTLCEDQRLQYASGASLRRSALHCAMDRRTSEMDGGALALRILRTEKDLMRLLETR